MGWGQVAGYAWKGATYHVSCLPGRAWKSDEYPTAILTGQDDDCIYGEGCPASCSACLEYLADDGADYLARGVAVVVTLAHEDENGNPSDDYADTWKLYDVVPRWDGSGVTDAVYAEAQRRGIPRAYVTVEDWADLKK